MMTEPQLQMCLGEALYNLIKIAPHNPVVKGLILQKIMKPVPDEVAPEAIMPWLLENATIPVVKALPPKRNNDYKFHVSYSENEYGKCNYSVDKSYEGDFAVSHQDMLNMLEDSNEDLNTFIEKIEEYIRDNAIGELEETYEGDFEYDDHCITDGEIEDFDTNVSNIAEDFFNEHVDSNAEDMPF